MNIEREAVHVAPGALNIASNAAQPSCDHVLRKRSISRTWEDTTKGLNRESTVKRHDIRSKPRLVEKIGD